MKYVVGFAFNHDDRKLSSDQVLLIHKKKPEWQNGKVNGVGGKIEEGESAIEAMVREFEEETGLITDDDWWRELCIYECRNGDIVYFFYCFYPEVDYYKKNTTEEILEVFRVRYLPTNAIYNLYWLVPLAVDNNIKKPLVIQEKQK